MTSRLKRASRTGESRSWTALHRLTSGLLTLLVVTAGLTGSATAAGPKGGMPQAHRAGDQPLAVLAYGHRVYRFPRPTAPVKGSIPARRPITGEATTLPVVGQATDRGGQRWLKVMVPGRPNSSTGWIKRAGTQPLLTSWSIRVNLAARHVWVYHHGRLARNFPAVVGKPSTPTPTGHFFVEESVVMPTSEPGGPFALALSARSDVLHQFAGGPGEIAIHGRDGLGGTPGQAQSHGCIRLDTADITWLSARIVPGTQVTIR